MSGSIGSIGSSVEGNTNPLPPASKKAKTRQSMGKRWCFTLNNYTMDQLDQMYHRFDQKAIKYIVGQEVGSSGTAHLQGYLESPVRFRPIEALGLDRAIHWELARGSREDNLQYCSKDGRYVTNLEMPEVLLDPLAAFDGSLDQSLVLYPWQNEVLGLVEEPACQRKIYWYCGKEGNEGKTSLAKHICMKDERNLYVSGKAADVKFAVSKLVERGKFPKVVIFGLPRTSEGYVSYAALEEVKDGIFFSGKYESGMCMFNPPHIIVFANFLPEISKMSKDRWKIYSIVDNEAVEKDVDEEIPGVISNFNL